MNKLTNKPRRYLIGILSLILICLFFLNVSLQFSVGDNSQESTNSFIVIQTGDWFDHNWTNCKRIEVFNPGVALTNYSVKIGLTPRNFNYSAAQVDGDDIRFTYLDNVTLLNYWLEEWNNATTSTVWVKIPTIEASINTTILLYYGNENATSLSDGSNVFDIFDDFSGDVLRDDLWNVIEFDNGGSQSYVVEDGELNVNVSIVGLGSNTGFYFLLKENITQQNYVIGLKSRWKNLDYYRGYGIVCGMTLRNNLTEKTQNAVGLRGDEEVTINRYLEDSFTYSNVADYSQGTADFEYKALGSSFNLSLSGTYEYDYLFTEENFDYPLELYINNYIGGRDESLVSAEVFYDHFYIRNYTANEPLVMIEDGFVVEIVDNTDPTIILVSPTE
ncbi:MAG: DUF2341 domain-containing protein, partial [Candidatus Heimdallarchaeota archaeon]